MRIYKGNSGSLKGCNFRGETAEENDFYATPPEAVQELLKVEKFNHYVWEPACGKGHISKGLEKAGYDVCSTDLFYRGFGDEEPLNFLDYKDEIEDDIITNPPYSFATQFVLKSLELLRYGGKAAFLLKLTFLSSAQRKQLFAETPPKVIYVFTKRIECGKNGIFEGKKGVDYAWFIWEKGFKGDPIVKWIN